MLLAKWSNSRDLWSSSLLLKRENRVFEELGTARYRSRKCEPQVMGGSGNQEVLNLELWVVLEPERDSREMSFRRPNSCSRI